MLRERAALCVTAFAVLAMAAPANAGATIPADVDHLIEGDVTGTLVVIDVPTLSKTTLDTAALFTPAAPGGPTWVTDPVAGTIAHAADNGFYVQTTVGDQYAASPWEPDGTPYGEAYCYGAYNGAKPEVSYLFNVADCGIDIPDGSVINAIYTTWTKRGKDNANYSYTEGDVSDMVNVQFPVAPLGDMVLCWYDADGVGHNANFQRIFEGPITVTGGDGFRLNEARNPNTAHIDAVILDVTLNLPPELFGDANGDGYVDDSDLSLLLANWQKDTDWAHGEFSGEPPVNDDDLSLLLSHWTGASPAGTTVPEPAVAALLVFGGLATLRRPRE